MFKTKQVILGEELFVSNIIGCFGCFNIECLECGGRYADILDTDMLIYDVKTNLYISKEEVI